MKASLQIALRNLARNRRRSFFTMLAIGLGYGAVNIFGGFTHYVFGSLHEGYVYAQANGHLTVSRADPAPGTTPDETGDLLSDEEVARIRAVALQDPDVLLVTPQLDFSGLVSNGDTSAIFYGVGSVPSDVARIRSHARGFVRKIKLYEGEALDDALPYGVCLGVGLGDRLHLGRGSTGVMMAPTVAGHVNALDFVVRQTIRAPAEFLDDQLVVAPLAFAQSLYDTRGVSRLNLLLRRRDDVQRARARLQARLREIGSDATVRTWEEMSPFYVKVRDMFNVIFLFIFVIVFVIAAMSVVNTVGMAVLERTREIGTLRALGLRRRGVIRLFAAESALLGLFGCGLGMVLTLAGCLAVRALEPTWVPPLISRRVPLEVHLVPAYLLASLVFLVALSLLAAVAPARRAAAQGIVSALGHA